MAVSEVRAVAFDSPDSVRLREEYFAELAERFGGFDPPKSEELRADAAGGTVLLVYENGTAIACGSLRWLDRKSAEVKRMFVTPPSRGRGYGRRVLRALEEAARAKGAEYVVLDTAAPLTEAARLYAREGYRPIAPYNDNPYAAQWFCKRLR